MRTPRTHPIIRTRVGYSSQKARQCTRTKKTETLLHTAAHALLAHAHRNCTGAESSGRTAMAATMNRLLVIFLHRSALKLRKLRSEKSPVPPRLAHKATKLGAALVKRLPHCRERASGQERRRPRKRHGIDRQRRAFAVRPREWNSRGAGPADRRALASASR